MISKEDILKRFKYDDENGILISNFSGRPVIGKNTGGYLMGRVGNKMYLVHRLIWFLEKGGWPKYHLDHIDHNILNNHISNLREATRSDNNRNTTSHKGSTSKYLGVSWDKNSNKWRARCLNEYLGCFDNEEEAALAYNIAARKYYGEFANLNQIKV